MAHSTNGIEESEIVAILDAGAQYGKVSHFVLIFVLVYVYRALIAQLVRA